MTDIEFVQRLSSDLRKATATMSEQEARFLVDAYYIMQEARKRTANQVAAMGAEPHAVLQWLFDQNDVMERQIKNALDRYTSGQEIGRKLKNVYGIGPVIAAGLIAHIDITKCETVGHIWSFAGLDPSKTWNKGQKRPWNAQLKTLCWHIGQSFMKFSARDDCYYGKVYRSRKEFEIERNESGGNAARAQELVAKFNKSTEAYKHLSGGKLPPAQIDARARRYAVKLFLAHLHQVWWKLATGKDAPLPYAITRLGHGHIIGPPPEWN